MYEKKLGDDWTIDMIMMDLEEYFDFDFVCKMMKIMRWDWLGDEEVTPDMMREELRNAIQEIVDGKSEGSYSGGFWLMRDEKRNMLYVVFTPHYRLVGDPFACKVDDPHDSWKIRVSKVLDVIIKELNNNVDFFNEWAMAGKKDEETRKRQAGLKKEDNW